MVALHDLDVPSLDEVATVVVERPEAELVHRVIERGIAGAIWRRFAHELTDELVDSLELRILVVEILAGHSGAADSSPVIGLLIDQALVVPVGLVRPLTRPSNRTLRVLRRRLTRSRDLGWSLLAELLH